MENKVGYRFCPTDDELVGFFLRHKIEGNDSLVEGDISEVNICSFDPWNLRFESKIKSRDPIWYFFSRRENKYANGDRQSRRTSSGFWKITGEASFVKDKRGDWCKFPGENIGLKRVLVFLTGKSSKGIKSDWVMHEFHSLFPEHQKTYVICRLEYKGNDRSILFVNPSYTTPTFVPNATNSAGSVVDQSRQGHSGFSEYDSATQGHRFNGNFNTQQPVQGNSGSFNHFSLYDSANQVPRFGGNFNTQQPVEGFSESFNLLSEYGSADQGQGISDYFNLQQQVPNTAPLKNDSEIIRDFLIEEIRNSIVDERTSMQEHCSDYRPKKPVTGIFDDDSGDSDTDSMTCGDTSSTTDSVGSSNEPYHTPIHDTPSLNTIEPLHNCETQEQPKKLKLQLQSEEKVIDTQKSESEWKMAEDSIKKTPSTNTVKQSWIVLEKIQRNEQWSYPENMIIAFLLLCISIIGWIILVG